MHSIATSSYAPPPVGRYCICDSLRSALFKRILDWTLFAYSDQPKALVSLIPLRAQSGHLPTEAVSMWTGQLTIDKYILQLVTKTHPGKSYALA